MSATHSPRDATELRLDPATRAFVARLVADEAPPLDRLTLDEARAALPELQRHAAVTAPDADVADLVLPVGPTGRVPVRVVRPPRRDGLLLGVVYGHGGGWVFGDRHTHHRLIRSLAVAADAAIVFVDYDRAPEARHPVQNEQAYAVLGWLADNGAEVGVDPQRLAVAGDSSGANMATVVALLAKRRGGPPLAAQVLFFPTTDAAFDTPSYHRYADGPYLDRAAMQWFWDHYLPDHARRGDPTAAPLHASLDDLAGLPPALVITAEHDPLRDEGEHYAHRLADAGVDVTAARYLGAIHAFVVLDALAATPAARAAIAQAGAFLSARLRSPRDD
jgi:acetyl esterase